MRRFTLETSLIDEDLHTVQSSPNVTRRIAAVMVGTLLLTSLLAVLLRAPLEEPATPSITPNPAKAPWYFLWLQELVSDTTFHIGHFTVNGALLGGVLLPGILILGLIAWPYFDKSPASTVGVWFATERKRQIVIFLIVVLCVVIFTVIGTFLRGPYWDFYWPWQTWPEVPRKF